jgi:hypothetical protein
VRGEIGVTPNPPLTANNSRTVSVVLNRFLDRKFTVLFSSAINLGNSENQLVRKIREGL